jgi:hypothetical protein
LTVIGRPSWVGLFNGRNPVTFLEFVNAEKAKIMRIILLGRRSTCEDPWAELAEEIVAEWRKNREPTNELHTTTDEAVDQAKTY